MSTLLVCLLSIVRVQLEPSWTDSTCLFGWYGLCIRFILSIIQLQLSWFSCLFCMLRLIQVDASWSERVIHANLKDISSWCKLNLQEFQVDASWTCRNEGSSSWIVRVFFDFVTTNIEKEGSSSWISRVLFVLWNLQKKIGLFELNWQGFH